MDEYQVIYKETFLADLKGIVRAVADDNPEAARKLGLAILNRADSLAFFPERHPRIRQRPELRRFIIQKHYKVFYRVRREAWLIEVLRCWDGRRGSNPAM